MVTVREADVRALLELVAESNAQRSLHDFRSGLLPRLRHLVGSDFASYNEVEAERAYVLMDPSDALDMFDDPGTLLARNGANHPLISAMSTRATGAPTDCRTSSPPPSCGSCPSTERSSARSASSTRSPSRCRRSRRS